ncbi:MAG: putative DNA-binding transcriptional regulator YafY [Acidimicrobiales bacterium]|jgi:predicted DNA-binding transcriptional regulator YafY
MRADRLVATLLFLQAKGRATAAEVAAELEVSQRTARRDLEALAVAGVPVYSTAGKGGGWSLIGGARTDLTGLSATEARALMMVTGAAPSTTPALKAAVRKLVQALPETFRADAEAAVESTLVDPSRWGRTVTTDVEPPHLDALQRAVVEGKQVTLGYQTPNKAPSVRRVHPLGIVMKAQVWYLVCGTAQGDRTFRISRVTSVETSDDPVEKRQDFNLEDTWKELNANFASFGRTSVAVALAHPDIMKPLEGMLGHKIQVGAEQPDGRFIVNISGISDFMLAVDLAAFGGKVEVLSPPGVRSDLAVIGKELVDLYA